MPVSRVESAGYSTEPLLVAHTVIDVFLSIDAQSADKLTMAEGIVQKRLKIQDHKETQATQGPPGKIFYYV